MFYSKYTQQIQTHIFVHAEVYLSIAIKYVHAICVCKCIIYVFVNICETF